MKFDRVLLSLFAAMLVLLVIVMFLACQKDEDRRRQAAENQARVPWGTLTFGGS